MDCGNAEAKILYVEDDAGTRTMLGKLLQQKYPAVTVLVASNGEEGLALFDQHQPELIVTDISMPVMNGIEMSMAIRKRSREAIIIVVTALTDSHYLSQSADIGININIFKPIRFNDFFSAIDSSLASVAHRKRESACACR